MIDSIVSDKMVSSRPKVIQMFAHAYTILHNELQSELNTKYPKIKEYLTMLSEITMNYILVTLSAPEFLLEGTKFTNFAEYLAEALYDFSINNFFPEDFINEVRGQIEQDLFEDWIRNFYGKLIRSLGEVQNNNNI